MLENNDTDNKGLIQSVVMAADVLGVLAANGPMGVTQLARQMSMPKARTHRYLKTLTVTGFVTQNEDTGRYEIGVRLWLVGCSVAKNFEYLRVARASIEEIRRRLGHTVVIGQIEKDGVIALDAIPGTSPMQIGTVPGTKFLFHASSLGKVALAFGSPELLERTLRSKRVKPTEKARTDADWLVGEIEKTRSQGWAVAPEEVLVGINSLAAPVFEADGSLCGVIAAVDSIQYLPPEPSKEQIDCVTDVARQISAQLGYNSSVPSKAGI